MDVCWERRNARVAKKAGGRWVLLLCSGADCRRFQSDPPLELGSIEDRYLSVRIPATRAFHQGLFWQRVRERLAALSIEPADRARLESAIAEKIPLPPGDWALWGVTCIPCFEPKL